MSGSTGRVGPDLEDVIAHALRMRDELGDAFDVDEACAERPEWRDDVALALRESHVIAVAAGAVPSADPRVGQILGDRYQIDERIGSGAMGIVYGALDLELGRSVAVKVLNLGLIDESSARERFDRESVVLGSIRHGAIVTVFDRGLDGSGTPYFVMERISGTSLADVLDAIEEVGANPLEVLRSRFGIRIDGETSWVRLVARWTSELADGLAVAHASGISHGDVKPSNVMVRADGRPVLLDFGIALADSDHRLTRTGATLGTPAYMPPEALSAPRCSGPATDTYGLAATLYHLVTFTPPYSGTTSAILAALAQHDPPPPRRVADDVPLDLQAIVETGMARDRGRRYSTTKEMGEDLRSFLAHLPVRARATSAVERVWRRAKRSKALRGAAVLAIVLALATGTWFGKRFVADRNRVAYYGAIPAVPANMAIVRPQYRRIIVPEAHEAAEDALDRLVASGHDPVTARALRAAFRFDHGDRLGAARDIRRLATIDPSPFVEALAERYEAAAAEPDAKAAMLAEPMPSPERASDMYLAGFHALREGDLATAKAMLQGDVRYAGRHAVELALVLQTVGIQRCIRQGDRVRASELAAALARETRALEADSGLATATTCHLLSFANARMGRYGDAVIAGRRGVALSAGTHVTLQNLATSARRQGELEQARDFVARALERAPDYLPLLEEQIRIDALTREYDVARERIAALPPAKRSSEARVHAELVALVDVEEALDHLGSGHPDRAIALAEHAVTAIDESGLEGGDLPIYRAVANGLRSGELAVVSATIAEALAGEPLSVGGLEKLLVVLSDDLSVEESAAIRELLVAVVDHLRPELDAAER